MNESTRSGQFIDPDLGRESVYREAACSLAILGVLAPFVEGTIGHGIVQLAKDFVIPTSITSHVK
jgi:hypothetical protein